MATAIINVKVTGTIDVEDRRAMDLEIGRENARRAALNPPLDPLPMADNTQRRSSYEIIRTERERAAHLASIVDSNVATLAEIRVAWNNATDQQRNAALAALSG